jgi:hypothetical protein
MPHPARIGWPAWAQTLPRLKAGLYACDNMRQPCGTERAPTGARHFAHHPCAEPRGSFIDVLCHIRLPPLLAFRLLGRRGIFQWKSDLELMVVDNQSDGSLPRLTSHPVEKVPQHGHLLVNHLLARVALDHNRVIEQELTTLGVVTPNAFATREGSGPTKQCAKHFQSFLDPVPLVDGPIAAILAGDKQHQQR